MQIVTQDTSYSGVLDVMWDAAWGKLILYSRGLWDSNASKVCSYTTYKLYPIETEYSKYTKKEAFLQI